MQSNSTIKIYLQEIGRNRVLTKDEEFELFHRLRSGDERAREEIINCNLRLVVRLAIRFQGKGVILEDLIQEGNIGLLEVIDRFDHTLGFRFSTYAAFWIRQAMQVAVRKQGSLIRLPVRKARQLGRVSELINEFHSTAGRAPSAAELAERMSVTESQVDDLVKLTRTALSLDSALDEDGQTLQERIADENTPLPSEDSMRRELERKVHKALSQLSEREHSILHLRFGLGGHKARSLRNVSRRVGLSQEGVRRVEQRALAKLAKPSMRSQLAGLL
jgi:RNA polymerase primary sigma factor